MTDHHLPARRQALPILIGFIVSAALAVTAVRCTSRDNTPPSASSAEPSHGAEQAQPAAPVAASEPARSADPEPVAQKPVEQRNAGATSIGRLLEITDAHDRTLLADIERKSNVAPDETVYQLLALRRAGKPRAALERFIQDDLQGGVAVKMIAMRWLREIHGEPSPAPSGEPLLRGPGEPDPQPRTVKPLTKTSP
jgi:hypothetical protein